MIGIIIGLIVSLIVLIAGIIMYKIDEYCIGSYFLAIISGISTISFAIVIAIFAYGFKASEYQTSIINREYKTNYTKEEVFYAKDVIETIRQLDRTRIEFQGDIDGN